MSLYLGTGKDKFKVHVPVHVIFILLSLTTLTVFSIIDILYMVKEKRKYLNVS